MTSTPGETATSGPESDTDGPPPTCMGADGDGYGEHCDLGPDCNDNDDNVWTDEGCANCKDADGDHVWSGCDAYDDEKPGPDCNDGDGNVWTDNGCANCSDGDSDGVWSGCDVYDDEKPGPDCNDGNPEVGTDDSVEICDGLAQNCAGEIDPLPAAQMCPPRGVEAPTSRCGCAIPRHPARTAAGSRCARTSTSTSMVWSRGAASAPAPRGT